MKKRIFLLILVLLSGPSLILAAESVQLVGMFSEKAVINIDGKHHILSPGDSVSGVKYIKPANSGVLIEIDGENRLINMGAGISLDFQKTEKRKKVLYANNRGMFFSVGSINGQSVKFIVDTGATTVAMSETLARRLNIPYRLKGRISSTNTASGIAKAWIVKLDKVKVGEIAQRNVTAAVIEGEYPRFALLGMSFLSRLKVEKDGDMMVLETR